MLWYFRPTDYFESAITHKGKVISNLDGTYCGYLNFDNIRYWDGRFIKPFKVTNPSLSSSLMTNILSNPITAEGRI